MKSVLFIYFALFILVAFSCQKSSVNKSSGELVNANSCSSNPANCNSSLYQQSYGYSNYGNTSSPFNYYNNSAYLCNCPYGTVPTYNSYAGLGCVQTSYYSSDYQTDGYLDTSKAAGLGIYGYIYVGWSNNQWYGQPQVNSFYYGSSSSSCYSGAIQSCLVGQSNSCPGGSFCRSNGANSSLGLCVTTYR